jgi:hypothetical protein
MKKPAFVTFTGVDTSTSIEGMMALRARYPIEWAVLFSPGRQGSDPRYPALSFVSELAQGYPHELAAHLCGGHTRAVLDAGASDLDERLERFGRAQLNGAPEAASHHIWHWGRDVGVQPIMQCRDQLPDDPYVAWLFDASGGRGIAPTKWPIPPTTASPRQWGFAGGLNPSNVAQAVATIGTTATDYWVDMETGVRDEHDRLDLERCRMVCEAIYGSERAQ